jgi:hypothetical protein
VNFSTKRYWTGLNVMKRMNKGCKNSGTMHWTKRGRSSVSSRNYMSVCTLPSPPSHLTVPDLPVQLLCSHYAIEVQG